MHVQHNVFHKHYHAFLKLKEKEPTYAHAGRLPLRTTYVDPTAYICALHIQTEAAHVCGWTVLQIAGLDHTQVPVWFLFD